MGRHVVDYHLSENELVLSLKYINRDYKKVKSVAEDLDEDLPPEATVTTAIRELELGSKVYGVYAGESHPQRLPKGWEVGLGESDVILTDQVISTFGGVSDEWEERGRPLNWYKPVQVSEIADVFERVEWRQSVPAVAGELMSCLVCKHPLPNANHRTAVAMMRTYLDSVADGDTTFESAGNYEGDWYDWARSYIHESKRLLMLRRKTGLLRHLKTHGATCVRRKSSVEIDLSAYDFANSKVAVEAEREHRSHCVRFATELIERSGHSRLLDKTDDGKRAFVDRLR